MLVAMWPRHRELRGKCRAELAAIANAHIVGMPNNAPASAAAAAVARVGKRSPTLA
jgi:hypothetical protein